MFPKYDIAGAACISEMQIWDISNPAEPTIITHIPMPPGMQIAHSSAFTWDGEVVIFSDEYGGAAGGGGCTGEEDGNVGAMFFYDISNPESPVLKGHYGIPRIPPVDDADEADRFRCTTHNYNVLPMRRESLYVVASSYYTAGLSVVDFQIRNPQNAREIGYYLPLDRGTLPDMWSAYWYNGRIYTNEHASSLGVSAFVKDGLRRSNVKFFRTRLNPQTQIARFR